METFDVIVLVFTGVVTGLSAGLAIRGKQVNNLKYQIDAADSSYARLLDLYMEKFYSQSLENAKLKVAKKSPGRPKGSKNKTKDNGKPTTRKYTRKSSK